MSEDATNHESRITNHDSPDDDGISLLDLAIVLARRKKLVLGLPIVSAVVAALVSLLLPNIYTATARILPPQASQSSTTALLAQFGALIGGGGGASPLAFRNPNDLYVGMLRSRTVADSLVDRFELRKVYDKSTVTDARKKLVGYTRIASGRDGIITIEFEDKDPGRAAAVTNGYIEEFYKLTSSLAITEASQRRLFFEKQLKQAREQLARAEFSLRQSIDSKGLAGIDVQSRAVLEPSAQLRAQITLREVQLDALRIFATDDHPDAKRLRHETASMKRELAKLEGGDGAVREPAASQEGLENLRRFKEAKFLERLTELLAQQFEAAKIDEARDLSIVQVLDRAVEPERKSGPQRSLIVLLAALLAGLIAVFWAFVLEALERARKNPEQAGRLQQFQSYLFGK